MSGKEIKVNKEMMIVSRTNTQGIIEYANPNFSEITGYALSELVGKPHNIVRHPDMPKIIFKWMWERIQSGRDMYAVVKNRTKNGDYYWVTTKFDIRRDPQDQAIIGYVAYRKAAPAFVVESIEKLYRQLLEIEHTSGVEASEVFLKGFLDTKGMTYDEYLASLVGHESAFQSFFHKMADLFR